MGDGWRAGDTCSLYPMSESLLPDIIMMLINGFIKKNLTLYWNMQEIHIIVLLYHISTEHGYLYIDNRSL